jgi:hypothetical protein
LTRHYIPPISRQSAWKLVLGGPIERAKDSNSLLTARACVRARANTKTADDTLGPVATINWLILNQGVVACSTVENVQAETTEKCVIAIAAEERVIAVATD